MHSRAHQPENGGRHIRSGRGTDDIIVLDADEPVLPRRVHLPSFPLQQLSGILFILF